ncbi:MmgE/PrpD family protein [Chloroflexota bacterium]
MPKFVPISQEDPMSTLCRMVLATRYEDLPSNVIDHAKKGILHILGATIGGSAMEGIPTVVDFVKDKGGKAESIIPFYGGKVPASEAAFAIGPMSRAMQLGDGHPEGSHCSEYVFPTLLATTGLKEKVSGKEFLTAFVVGQELLIRIGIAYKALSKAVPLGRYGGHFIFGCVAAAGKLLDLSLDELENAQGIAGTMTQPHSVLMFSPGTLMGRVHQGFICQDTINACLLTQRGITGPRRDILAAPQGFLGFAKWETDAGAALKGLGEEWEILNVYRPCFPASATVQRAIGGMLDQVREHNFKGEDIARIDIDVHTGVYTHAHRKVKWNPQTAADGQHSMPYVTATAACNGDFFIDAYTPEAMARQDVRDLMTNLSISEDASLSRLGTRITTTLKDGTKYSKVYPYVKGHPEEPLTEQEVIEIFKKCVPYSAYKLSDGTVDSVINAVLNIEKVDDIAEALLAPLTPK